MEGGERFIQVVLEALGEALEDAEPREIVVRDEHTNDLAEVRFADGRTLMVKRAADPDAGARFRTSRVASDLLRKRVSVVAPRHLEFPARLDEHPVEAYWRIPYPTLYRLWPKLDDDARTHALEDWGRLLRRVHLVELEGNGALLTDPENRRGMNEFLTADLGDRLRPSIAGVWPEALEGVDALLDFAPEIAERVGERSAVLVHNDLWMGNVLCVPDDASVALECVGVLDLEDAFAGAPELDLAKIEVLHGPLFGHELHGDWFPRVLAGYNADVEPAVLGYFRAYHLVNMGFHAAVTGYDEHAGEVARAVDREVRALVASPGDLAAGRGL